ncbi:MAG: branched-chain amino acid ABC transporter permease [Oscillospiraceae bacterium]|nr:branched-chain amino acid ABC transporter permease [Oscillospiraceae bacterium]
MLNQKTNRKRNLALTAILLLAIIGLLAWLQATSVTHSYAITIIERSCIYAVAAVTMNLMIGFSGLFSLGTAGFMCLGAYITGILTMPVAIRDQVYYLYGMASWLHDVRLPLVAALLIAAAIAAVLAFLVGWPVLRLKSDYLAIATLGFSEIVRAVLGWDGLGSITNASYGLSNIPAFSSIFECVAICAACIGLMVLLLRSSYGRTFIAIRDNEVAAEAMGINLFRTKQLAFVVSSAFAAVAGGLLAVFMRSAVTSTFMVSLTYNILLMVVLGGIGSVTGSIVGSFLVTCSQEWLRFLDSTYVFGDLFGGIFRNTGFAGVEVPLLRTGFRMVIFSILLMVVVLFWNRGLMGANEFSWDGLLGLLKKLGRGVKRLFTGGRKKGGADNG